MESIVRLVFPEAHLGFADLRVSTFRRSMCQQQIFSQNYLSIVIHKYGGMEEIINILLVDIVEFFK